mgnify:CR=1 FL=1
MYDDYGLGLAQAEYDRQEPPEAKVVVTCAYCGRDIYAGEKIYRIDNDIYCTDCVTEEDAEESEYQNDEY